jgi:RNA polymerase sigma-70 factor (ECF subfamily)
MTWDEITTLVMRAQAGDRSAYGELVQRFEPTVYAVALARLRNPGEAQELAQEVFVHGMSKLRQLRDPQCFAGWLRQITVRMAINRLTRRGPIHGAEPTVLDNVQASDRGPLEDLIRTEEQAELYDGLRRLKPLDRATLVAFYLRGRSLRQMSREFETPVGTIKRRLHVARKRLRRQLEGTARGLDSSELSEHGEAQELACV